MNIVLAEPHDVVRVGLRALVADAPGLGVVGELADPLEAPGLLDELERQGAPVDLLLYDLPEDPQEAGHVASVVAGTETPTLATTWTDDTAAALAALEAGARGCVPKDASAEELLWAVRAAAAGHVVVGAAIARRLRFASMSPPPEPAVFAELTEREREVLAAITRGAPNKVIARELQIAERTARTHVSSILRKLGVSSRTEAALLAARGGLGRPIVKGRATD